MNKVAKKITREILNQEAIQSKLSKDKICYNLKMFSILSKNLKYDKQCTKCGVKINSSNFYIGRTKDTYQIESMCRTHWLEHHKTYLKEMKKLNPKINIKKAAKEKLREIPEEKSPKCYDRAVFNFIIDNRQRLGIVSKCIDCGVKINHRNFYLIPAKETKIGYTLATRCRSHFKLFFNNYVKAKRKEKKVNYKKSFNVDVFNELNVKSKFCNICGVKITKDNFKLRIRKDKTYGIEARCKSCIRNKEKTAQAKIRNKRKLLQNSSLITNPPTSLKDRFKNFIYNLFR